MSHNLFLGMYTFAIKQFNTSNSDKVEVNQFLSEAYPNKEPKFSKGFVQDIINLLEEKAFKNTRNTHGATLADKSLNNESRILDLLIDGGLTGIKQFIIDESGNSEPLSDSDIIGPKFYCRIWLPAKSYNGYLFIQKYGSLSIKPIFDDILKKVLKRHNFNLINSSIQPTTTKARMKKFYKYSTLRDVIVVSNQSSNSTGPAKASSAVLRLNNFQSIGNKQIDRATINAAMQEHGFSMGNRHYQIKATYENKSEDFKEERTVILDSSDETINVIPNIRIPKDCIDKDNYPDFQKMKAFVDQEMLQVKLVAKL